jgi:hypothetical protein
MEAARSGGAASLRWSQRLWLLSSRLTLGVVTFMGFHVSHDGKERELEVPSVGQVPSPYSIFF